MMTKYMQVVWLYVIGLIIIFVGIYTLMTSPGPTSFIIMLVGLGIAAMGAAHGRRMRMMGQLDIEQIMKEKGFQPEETEKPNTDDFEKEGEKPPGEAQQRAAAMAEMGTKIRGLMQSFKRRPADEPMSQEEILQLEIDDIKDGKIVPTEADIIEFVCPKCGAENEERNYFCFKCGNRLRKKTPGEDDTGTHLKVEPGTIEIVEDQRVAKVVICPKCNVPNKVGDKFCWRCGKKIRSESKEAKKIEMEESLLPKKDKSNKKKKSI